MHVLIVGAGLGGLSLAQSLRKQGISFEIFERDDNKDSRFQGWAIGLHTIIDELAASFPDDVGDLKQATDHLQPLRLPAQIGLHFPGVPVRLGVEDTSDAPIIRAERYRLREWLATNIPIQWGKRVTNIKDNDQEVVVHFEDGTSARGDVLVGADGIKSVVREHLLKRPSEDILKLVPIAAIVGELTLSGEAFKRQLALGHSAYIYVDPDSGFWSFCGLHHVLPDGLSGRHYWMFMCPDADVANPEHWLQSASQQDKLDCVLKAVAKLPPKFREIFESTPASGIKQEPHIWRDLELESLPSCRVILLGDAAHAMTPFRGEGGYHALVDALNLSKVLKQVNGESDAAFKIAVTDYNSEMLARGREAVRASRNFKQAAAHGDGEKPKIVSANQIVRPLPEKEILLSVAA